MKAHIIALVAALCVFSGNAFGQGFSYGSGVSLSANNTWTAAQTFSAGIVTTTISASGLYTSSVASPNPAIKIVGGSLICLNTACTTIIQDDGFGSMSISANGIGTASNLTLNTGGLFWTANSGTAGSGTGITTNTTGSIRYENHKLTVARTALTAAATTQDITIWTVPARTRVVRMIVDATAAFDDAAGPISAVTITCGKTAGGAEYVVSGSIFTVNTLGDAAAEVGASLNSYFGDIPSWSATTAIQCRFTSTGGNLSTLTTGSASFNLEVVTYP